MRIRSITINDDVAAVLRASTWLSANVLALPPGQLDRKLYEAVNKVLTALGGKWSKKLGGHQFAADAAGDLTAALDAGGVVDQKKTFEQFFTPPGLARRMAQEIGIGTGDHVLEPSAGSGRLVHAALDEGADFVSAIEADASLVPVLAAMVLHSGGVWAQDFMTWTPAFAIPIDAVLMNPPFSGNQDIAHVTRALSFLRPGGKLAAIMSPHFTFADDQPSREFRALIEYERTGPPEPAYFCGGTEPIAECSVELLPAGTFKESGTNVSAVLALIEKSA